MTIMRHMLRCRVESKWKTSRIGLWQGYYWSFWTRPPRWYDDHYAYDTSHNTIRMDRRLWAALV